MFTRFGCVLLSVGLMLTLPASAQDETTMSTVAGTAPEPVSGLQPTAYDVIVVPRPVGSVRSRMFNGERWVTVPDGALRPYLRPYLPRENVRGAQRRWSQREPRQSVGGQSAGRPQGGRFASRDYASRDYANRDNANRDNASREYQGRWESGPRYSGRTNEPRAYADDFGGRQRRDRSVERRYLPGSW